MNDRQLVNLLKEIANKKRLEYVKHSVRAKLLRKSLVEARARGKFLKEDVTQANAAPGMRATTEVPFGRPAGGSLKSSSYENYPDPTEVEDTLEQLIDSDALSGTESLAVFGMGSGPGTYRQLLADLKSASSSAAGAQSAAWSLDKIIAAFTDPTLPDSDKLKIRRAARSVLYKRDAKPAPV